MRVSHLLLLLAGARGSHGWGAVGHRTVGALALKHLDATAAAEANRLLGAHAVLLSRLAGGVKQALQTALLTRQL